MAEGFLVAGIALFFICGLVVIVGGFAALLFFYGRYADRKISAVWAEAAQATGITRMDDGKKGKPHMLGTVNGVQVLVDVYMQEHIHTRPDSTSRTKMPWTRVIAQLSSNPGVEVHPKGVTFGQKPELPRQTSGNPEFDARYQLHVPPDTNLDTVLPEAVRTELLAANPRVHIISDTVLWAQVRNVKEADLLIRAIRTTTRVAAAIQQN